MRPDEHKKKKNAAYKKKHGINNASKSADNTTDKKLKPKDSKSAKVNEGGAPSTPVNRGISKQSKSPVLSDSSDSDTEVVERKSYSRRQIVSNWEKYEVNPDHEDKITSRGEDFEKLLTMAGEAMSRFRFKDELEWEDDVMDGGGGDNGQEESDVSNFLTLDLADLSSSMSCVPIHQLLGIDQSLFPADQLESHIKSVNEKRTVYLNSISKDTDIDHNKKECNTMDATQSSASSTSNNMNTTITKILHKAKTDNPKSESSGKKISELTNLSTSAKKIERDDQRLKQVEPSGGRDVQIAESSQPAALMGLEDEDLDQLLDMDVVPEQMNSNVKKLMGNHQAKSPSSVSSEGKIDDKKEAEELEDWLDSILD